MLCDKSEFCPLFNLDIPAGGEFGKHIWKRYCLEDNTHCARLRIAETVGPEHVPEDLYPNMQDRADAIIQQVQSGR